MTDTAVNCVLCGITNNPGTAGNFTLGPAKVKRRSLDASHDGKTFPIRAEDGNLWEVRTGCLYTHASGQLTRGTLEDSSSGVAVNLTGATTISVVLSAGFTNSIIIRKDTVDADNYFGFRVGTLTNPTAESTLIANAPDSSAAMRDVEDYCANWQAKPLRLMTTRFRQGIYKFDAFTFRENAAVFYQKAGIRLKGGGPAITTFAALPGTAKGHFVGLAGKTNYTGTPIVEDVSLVGAGASNPVQVGVFLNPDLSNELGTPSGIGFGGITSAHWHNVQVRGFAREQVWIRGGSSSYHVPIQYGLWSGLQVYQSQGYSALKVTGQIGPPFNFWGTEAYGDGNWLKTTVSGSSSDTIVLNDTLMLKVGMSCVGSGVPVGRKIIEISSPAIRLDGAVSVSSSTLLCFNSEEAPLVFIGLDQRTGLTISSIDVSNNYLVFAQPHRLKTSDKFLLTGGRSWGGLATDTVYFAYLIDDYRIKVCTTLLNSSSSTPLFVNLTSATGIATVTSVQQNSIEIGAQLPVFETLTVQGGSVGLDVQNGHVHVEHLHAEDLKTAVKVGSAGNVWVNGVGAGNGGQGAGTGSVFDASATGSTLTLSGSIALAGNSDKIVKTPDYENTARTSEAVFTGAYYPTVGLGISGKLPGLTQMGNATEVDIGQKLNSEFILNTGTNVIQHIRSQGMPGQSVTFRAWHNGNVNEYVEFGTSGSLHLANMAAINGTLRVPARSMLVFGLTSVSNGFSLLSVTMPIHSNLDQDNTGAWTISGSIVAGSSISKTVTCGGARVGDPAPKVSISSALTPGLFITGEVTATDTVTVRIFNFTAGALAGPTNPVVYVKQTR